MTLCEAAGGETGEESASGLGEDEKGLDSLAALKAEADKLGVEYGPRIGYETLLERVEQARG